MALPLKLTPDQAKLREELLDPAGFQRVALNRNLWSVQKRIAHAVATKRSVSVKGCHSSGKTFLASGLVLWWLRRYLTGKVITIHPTRRQVKLMWNEIALARAASKIQFPECTTMGLVLDKDRFAEGVSSSRGINVQGYHGSNVLIIVDEAPGIEGDIYDAIEGIRAGGQVTVLKLGNPTVPSGVFYDDFTRNRALTECITISAFDSPNLAGVSLEQLLAMSEEELDYSPWPLLTQRRWVKDRYRAWGPGNPRWMSRVLGEFPTQSDYAVFSLEWIERARREPTDEELRRAQGCVVQVGIDVAGPGDDETTGVARVNGIIIDRRAWADADPRGKVCDWLHGLRVGSYQLGTIVVDVVGIGYNFALHLADQNFPVYGFNAGHASTDPEKYLNQKAEQYFRLREMYKQNYISQLPGALDEECEAQLSGLNYKELPKGNIQIEPKDEARKRGVASPDRAEAEVLAFSKIIPREEQYTYAGDDRISPI